ncbi:MAG: SCP2 sterol-binding domain-containing protein [Candidatus Dormibacteria bacterium]
MATPSDIFTEINQRLAADPSKAGTGTAAYRFDLSGEDGGEFHIVLQDGKGEAGPGAPENPNTTISMAASDFVGMATGTMNPMLAFMGGKLKVRGDMALAMKLQSLMQ